MHGPYPQPPRSRHLPAEKRRLLLDRALHGVALGAWDEQVAGWLCEVPDTPTMLAIIGMLERARQVAEQRARPAPTRVANTDDLMTLLAVVRDALEAGHGDQAAMVLRLLLEHRGALGLRSRTYATLLREQMAERERPPGSPQSP